MRRHLPKLIIALVLALGSLVTYFSSRQSNPVTGETQYVALNVDQEIALGLQAAPEMAARFGGLDPDPAARERVARVGAAMVARSDAAKGPYRYQFHLLGDRNVVNAFALPGGQIFITRALLDKLQTDAQLAGVLGHEIGHVVGRHGAEHLAKQRLTQGLTGAAVIATYDPERPATRATAAIAAMVGSLINMRYGRNDELESDRLGVRFMRSAGHDPNGMIHVMQVLKAAGGGKKTPEFFSTHPDPDRRIERIREAIAAEGGGGT